MKMDQPKYREKVLIGLEAAPPSFDVRGKVLGPGGANLLYITKETGAVVTLRGKDSGYIEANGHESVEPLHICVEHSRYEVLQAGRQLAFNLIETVQQEWAFQKEQLLQQPPPVAQQGPPPAPPPQLQQPPPAPLQAQSVQLHPPQIVTSGQAVNTAPTHPNQHQLQVASATQNGNSSASGVQVSTVGGSGAVLIGSSGTSATPLQQGSAVGSVSGEHAAGGMLPTGDAGRPSPPHAQPTLQVQQPRQVFVSQQGSLLPQPAALIPQQQQVIPPGSLLAQQPHIIQASYPVQYMQTSNGQMVLAYPNIVRPVLSGAAAAAAAAADPTAGHQVMLVQYGQAGAAAGLRPTLHHQAAALRASQPMLAAAASPVSTGGALAPPQLTQPQQTATAAIPQIVQIVNPQTGQIQHVIQHIQPQLHMQQVQLGGSVAGAAGAALLGHQQVLMPVQQQLLTQLPGAAAAAALQFGTAAAATNTPHHLHHAAAAAAQQQQLIIAQQVAQQQLQSVGLTQQQQLLAAQTQVTSSSAAAAAAAGLLPAQQALPQPLPQLTQLSAQAQTSQQASTNQHQPTVSVQSTVQSAPQQGQKRRYEGEQNQFQSAPPPPSHHTNLSQTNSHTLRKGVGMEQRLQQNQQQSQQQVSQQQQQSQQQQTQQQQQSQEQQSQVQASADGSKAVQDEWRQQRETVNDLQGMRDLVEKLQQDQVKRARPYHTNDYLWSVAGVMAGRLQRNQRADLLLTNRYLNMEGISNSVASGDQTQLRAVNKTADKPTTYLNYIQQQQQQQQQSVKQEQQQDVWQQVYQTPPPTPHTPTSGTPATVQYLHQQHQVYQPPPQHPQFPPPTHQYNPWIVPQ